MRDGPAWVFREWFRDPQIARESMPEILAAIRSSRPRCMHRIPSWDPAELDLRPAPTHAHRARRLWQAKLSWLRALLRPVVRPSPRKDAFVPRSSHLSMLRR